jgi:hypothetical protein
LLVQFSDDIIAETAAGMIIPLVIREVAIAAVRNAAHRLAVSRHIPKYIAMKTAALLSPTNIGMVLSLFPKLYLHRIEAMKVVVTIDSW